MNKKRRSEIPAAPFLFVAVGCGRRHLKFSRLSFPADRATSPWREVRACSQRALCKRRLLRILRLRVAEEQFVGQPHLLPGTLLPQRKFLKRIGQPAEKSTNPAADCFGSKRLRRI